MGLVDMLSRWRCFLEVCMRELFRRAIALGVVLALSLSAVAVGQDREMDCLLSDRSGSICEPDFFDREARGAEGPERDPRIIVYGLDVDGGEVDERRAMGLLRRRLMDMQSCFEGLETPGAIRVRIFVGERGRVSRLDVVEASPGEEGVGRCFVNRARRLHLPGIEEGVKLTVTTHFRRVLREPLGEILDEFSAADPDRERTDEELLGFDASVSMAVESVEGVPEEAVALILRPHVKEVVDCYWTALKSDRTFSEDGRVRLKLTLGPLGQTAEATVTLSEPGHELLDRCIERLASHWVFPPPQESGEIEILFEIELEELADVLDPE
jgi:hypothetical protein